MHLRCLDRAVSSVEGQRIDAQMTQVRPTIAPAAMSEMRDLMSGARH